MNRREGQHQESNLAFNINRLRNGSSEQKESIESYTWSMVLLHSRMQQ